MGQGRGFLMGRWVYEPVIKIGVRGWVHYNITLLATSIESHPSTRSPSFPLAATSGSMATAFKSLSFTYPRRLHSPMHINARVDWTERRLRRCERMIRPWLKTHSTSTAVAAKKKSIMYNIYPSYLFITWNCKIIQCHVMEARIGCPPFIPPPTYWTSARTATLKRYISSSRFTNIPHLDLL